MNVKMERNRIVFKISEDELKILLAENILQEIVKVGSIELMLVIEKTTLKTPGIVTLEIKDANAELRLAVNAADVQNLVDMGRNKDGISFTAEETEITLQVDLRKDSRARAERA